MQEDLSTPKSFMEVAGRYLQNAGPLGLSWQVWVILGIIIVLVLGTWLWLRKKKKNETQI